MENNAVLVIVIAVLGVLMAAFLFATSRRRDTRHAMGDTTPERDGPSGDRLPVPVGAGRQTGREIERSAALERSSGNRPVIAGPPPAPVVAPDEEALGVTRRQVLNRGLVSTMTLAVSGFGAATIAMLWPSLSGGFGDKIRAGKLDEILKEIESKKEPFYVGAGRFYVVPYPKEAVAAAENVGAYSAVVEGYADGVAALYQKCPHLGCRVPWCESSQWFECPCHGSQYNRVGEKKGGPAPRGMDRFVTSVDGGQVVVDTKIVIPGPPIGTNTTGQEAEGPNCIGATEGGH